MAADKTKKRVMPKFLETFKGTAPTKAVRGRHLVPVPAKAYVVELERDEDGLWVVSVPALPGCHTQAKSIGQARERIREAMSLFDGVPANATLTFDIKGPQQTAVRRLRETRAKADAAAREAQEATQKLAAELVEQGFSLRDVGELLGVSFQRVQQLVKGV